MEFRLLGPLEVIDDGRSLPLGGPKQRTLLAHLLLRANEVITVERLVDGLWGDAPPETARNTIQTYVRHLRRTLGPSAIEHRSGGYTVVTRNGDVDAIRFADLVEQARRAAGSDPVLAAATLGEALDMWRGPALDDLADQRSLHADIARLEELRLGAVEERIAAELAMGRDRELVSELESLVGRHPFRERLWAHLMEALYRSGRQGDALTAYQRARDVLAEELGIDPSPDLQRLHERVLRQDEALQITGQPLRGYRLLEEIGAGPSGVVHRAYQPQVGREVAIKVIAARHADDAAFIRRFEAEAQHVARLEHPHIVPLYDFWREPGGAYLVMRFLRGGSLRDALARGPLAPDDAVRLAEHLAGALDAAHRQGVIHRGLKPANILFDEDGNAYLSDLGIAGGIVTNGSTPAGSVSFRAPEEAGGDEPTPRADVYALGLVITEALAGGPDRGEELDAVIARALADDPSERYPDAPTFAAALATAAATALAHPAPAAPAVTEVLNPFKGLRPFAEPDAADFFGRDALVARLVDRMREPDARMLGVVGPSGSGKSSVVRAGLLPALRHGALPGSDRWFIVEMHPGSDPFKELAAALTSVAVELPADLGLTIERDVTGLSQAAAAILPDGAELVLVVDQFEEVFTLVDDEPTRRRFLDALDAAATAASRVRVVVTLRADFYDRPLLYEPFGATLAAATEAVTPLFADELERAVSGPLARVGVAAEPALVAEIVAAVSAEPGALPLFQYALTELFEHRQGSTLTLEGYRAIGGVTGALAQTAEDLYAALDAEGRRAARQVFLRLVAVGEEGATDTRRRVLRAELAALEVDQQGIEDVIDVFGARRLLSFDRDPTSRGPTVEVAHEALLREWGRLRGWIEAAREQLVAQRRLTVAAHEWVAGGGEDGFLLRGAPLDRTAAYAQASGLALSADERAFLDASLARRDADVAEEQERQTREAALERRSIVRMRALVVVLSVAALLASGLSFAAIRQRGTARQQGRLATARELAAAASANLRVDPERSILLALHAFDVGAAAGVLLPEAEQVLHDALAADRLLFTLRHPSTANVEWSPDGRLIATGGTAGGRDQTDVVLWDAATGERLRVLAGHTRDIEDLSFSPDSSQLAAQAQPPDDQLIVWSTRTGEQVLSVTVDGPRGSVYRPDGRRIAVRASEGVGFLDARSGRPMGGFATIAGGCPPPVYSADGARLAVGSPNRVAIYDARTGRRQLSLRVDDACGIIFSPDGATLAVSTPGRGVSVFDTRTGVERFSLAGSDPIGMDQSPDGTMYATGETDGTARLWDASTGEELMVLAGHSGSVGLVAFSPDGSRLVTGGSDGAARVWDITPTGVAEAWGDDGPSSGWGLAFHPDGSVVAATGWDRGWLWDAETGRRVGALPVGGDIAFSLDGKTLAAGSIDFQRRKTFVAFLDPATGALLRRTERFGQFADRIDVASDIVGVAGPVPHMVRASTGEVLGDLPADADVLGVAVSPDGTLLAAMTGYATLFVWDVATGEEILRFQAHAGFGGDVAFAPDGRSLATSGNDGATVWNLEGERLATMTGAGRLDSLAFSPDGGTLAAVSAAAVALWDVATGNGLLTLPSSGFLSSIAYSPDGTRLAGIGADGGMRVYVVPPEDLIAIARARVSRGFTEQECRRYLHVETCPGSTWTPPARPEPRRDGAAGPAGAFRVAIADGDLPAGARSFDRGPGDHTLSLLDGRFRLHRSPAGEGELDTSAWAGSYAITDERISLTFDDGPGAGCFGPSVSARWSLRDDGSLELSGLRWRGSAACGGGEAAAWARALFASRPWMRLT